MSKSIKISILLALALSCGSGAYVYSNKKAPSTTPSTIEASKEVESGKEEASEEIKNEDVETTSSENKEAEANHASNMENTSARKVFNKKSNTSSNTNNSSNSNGSSAKQPSTSKNPSDANTNSNTGTKSPASDSKNTASSSENYPSNLPKIPSKYSVEFLSSVENKILELSNVERSKAGLAPLTMDNTMRQAARYKAEEMLQYGYFDHNSPHTGSPFDLLKSFNVKYNAAGENIQYSMGRDKASVTAEYIVTNWMNSPGHRANILNGNYKRMGIGVAFSPNGNRAYESQLFAN